VVVETGGDERVPIILGRPFLCTTKAIIYAEHTKIFFHHQGQEREVLVQEPHVALSCTTSGTIQIGRVSVKQQEEEK
jgi:hypothetical protein